MRIQTTVVLATVFLLAACDKSGPPPEHAQPVEAPEETEPVAEGSNDPTSPLNFKGKIAKRYEDSEEWWPPTYVPAPDKAPNVVLILLDDTGFAQLGSFGGLIETPNIDTLAEGGLRYNNFHTTALCSPSPRFDHGRPQPTLDRAWLPLAHRDGLPRIQCDHSG